VKEKDNFNREKWRTEVAA